MEKNYEYSDTRWKCKHNLVVESCSRCLFETLCRLEKQKVLDSNIDQWQNENDCYSEH